MVKVIERLKRVGRVDFCESCGQVCTPECRAEAHRDRARTTTMHLPQPLRATHH